MNPLLPINPTVSPLARPVAAGPAAPATEPAVVAEGKGSASPSAEQPGLTEQEQRTLKRMKARDQEVRAHEQAHASVGGAFAGSPSYQLEQGPDGNFYAVAGEVPINTAPISGDAKGTVEKMEQVIRAALAPAEPSSQDYRVAAEARATLAEAKAQLGEEVQSATGDPTTVADGKADARHLPPHNRLAPDPYLREIPSGSLIDVIA